MTMATQPHQALRARRRRPRWRALPFGLALLAASPSPVFSTPAVTSDVREGAHAERGPVSPATGGFRGNNNGLGVSPSSVVRAEEGSRQRRNRRGLRKTGVETLVEELELEAKEEAEEEAEAKVEHDASPHATHGGTGPKVKDDEATGGVGEDGGADDVPTAFSLSKAETTAADRSEFVLQELESRLRPDAHGLALRVASDGGIEGGGGEGAGANAGAAPPKQFYHLHHMKTGGTSLNGLIKCAVKRWERLGPSYEQQLALSSVSGNITDADASPLPPPVEKASLPFGSLSECSYSNFVSCTSGNTTSAIKCREKISCNTAMQFCGPLFAVNNLGWLDPTAGSVTVIRHPVDRVWSMFRFRTKSCYGCMTLLEVYEAIDKGNTAEVCGKCEGVCISQLLDHQTRNLLTTDPGANGNASNEEEMIAEAIWNLENRFTVVGVTDELPTVATIVGKVFPWMAETLVLPGPGGEGGGVNASSSSSPAPAIGASNPKDACPLEHKNASPKNNRCGPDGTHWDLPDEPDEETREAILRHNKMDLRLYETAKKRMRLQKAVLGLAEEDGVEG